MWAQFAARTGLDSVHQNDDVEPEPVWNLERDQRTERVLQAGSRLVVTRDADSDRFQLVVLPFDQLLEVLRPVPATQGNGSVLATKAIETQGEGTVSPAGLPGVDIRIRAAVHRRHFGRSPRPGPAQVQAQRISGGRASKQL